MTDIDPTAEGPPTVEYVVQRRSGYWNWTSVSFETNRAAADRAMKHEIQLGAHAVRIIERTEKLVASMRRG